MLLMNIMNLHSTMVLFKLCCSGTPRYFKLFTFHYGPIQILDIEDITSIGNYLHSTMVLFKYKFNENVYSLVNIYIPLWSYSN